jgi:rhomboid protease GluP
MKKTDKQSKAPIYILISVFLILVAGITTILFFSYDRSKEYPDKITALENLADLGKFAEVEQEAEEILKLKPGKETKTDALWEISLAETMQGKYDEAIEHARQFRKLDYSGSYYLMGLIYFYKGNHYSAAGESDTAKEDYNIAVSQFDTAKRLAPNIKAEIDQYIAAIPSQVPSE